MDNYSEEFSFQDEVKFWSMQFMAKIYLESSMICAKDAETLEVVHNREYYENSKYLKNVLGSIVFAVMYLEATINEFFISIVKDLGNNSEIKENLRKILFELWNLERVEKSSIIEKYQIALILMEKNQFNDSIESFQNIKLLISLRNYLVHYKPDWMEMNSSDNTRVQIIKLEKSLNGKYKLNDSTQSDDINFPIKYLNSNCAKWGITNSINFVGEVYNRLNINYLYDSIIHDLKEFYKIN